MGIKAKSKQFYLSSKVILSCLLLRFQTTEGKFEPRHRRSVTEHIHLSIFALIVRE